MDEFGDAGRELHTGEVLHAYLDRIGYTGSTEPTLEVLSALQFAHLVAVPFENLDVVAQVPVSTDTDTVVAKVLAGRGGWCFENNGAFAWLLEQLGFRVRRLGAAVLRSGPTVEIDHLALEVQLDRPYLVDVGFGDSFVRPLRLDLADPQRDERGEWELLSSPQGTTLAEIVDGVPVAQYRFKRVDHPMADFEPASQKLQADAEGRFRTKPLATRLLGKDADRVTLLPDRLTLRYGADIRNVSVAAAEWDTVLAEWFRITR
ncbi:MAG: arylamine N-acetyltransferase family protein [Acidimicrobiales bacterium]